MKKLNIIGKINKIGKNKEYEIVALDVEAGLRFEQTGEVDSIEPTEYSFSLEDAKRKAKKMIKDRRYIKEGVDTVRVLDESKDVVFEIFV
jgi:hypothetical protein